MFSDEMFKSHECDLPLKESKIIEVVYFRDDSHKDKQFMTGWGTDGVLYTFEVVPRKAIPIITRPSDGSYHDKDSDDKLPVPFLRNL